MHKKGLGFVKGGSLASNKKRQDIARTTEDKRAFRMRKIRNPKYSITFIDS